MYVVLSFFDNANALEGFSAIALTLASILSKLSNILSLASFVKWYIPTKNNNIITIILSILRNAYIRTIVLTDTPIVPI